MIKIKLAALSVCILASSIFVGNSMAHTNLGSGYGPPAKAALQSTLYGTLIEQNSSPVSSFNGCFICCTRNNVCYCCPSE